MPRIRKETSNRKSTNDRAKLRKQVKESRRKKTRDAKKSVQWKSKTPKDPGIPSEFPYKDQLLAEVAEQRRLAAEEKEKKKADKQRALAKARAIAKGEPFEDSDAEDNAEDVEGDEDNTDKSKISKDLNVGAESIASLSAKFLTTELKPRPRLVTEEEEEEEEEEVPVLINRDLPNLKAVLEKADVVIEVVDGRDPLAFRSKNVEELATEMGKKVLLVLNKIDTCPREAVASWSQQLRTELPTLLFRAASSFLPEASVVLSQPVKKGKGKAKVPVNDAVGADSLLSCLSQWSKEKGSDKELFVAVVGVANVGKSSLINSLLKRAALPVYTLASSSRGPTTTALPQEVTLELEGRKILLIDTPGLSFTSDQDADESTVDACRARDILLRSKGRIDRLKDVNPPIAHIVSRANTEDLMLMYSLAAFTKGDPTAFLSGVARANQLLKKKGELDLTSAARIVLRDWSVGKLLHYTTPPTTNPASTASSSKAQLPENEVFISQLYDKDESILAALPSRKERRKAGGLVKMSPGVLEERSAVVDKDWAGLEDNEDEEIDGDEHAEVDAEGMDVDEEEAGEEDSDKEADEEQDSEEQDEDEEEEEEEEEIVAPPPTSNKQKRKRVQEAPVPERPSKKVAFAAPPSKHARSKKVDSTEGKHTPKPATQKPLKSARAQTTESVDVSENKPVLASKVKPASKAKTDTATPSSKPTVKSPLEHKGKIANVAPKKAKAPSSAPKKDGSAAEAYDFGKFF